MRTRMAVGVNKVLFAGIISSSAESRRRANALWRVAPAVFLAQELRPFFDWCGMLFCEYAPVGSH